MNTGDLLKAGIVKETVGKVLKYPVWENTSAAVDKVLDAGIQLKIGKKEGKDLVFETGEAYTAQQLKAALISNGLNGVKVQHVMKELLKYVDQLKNKTVDLVALFNEIGKEGFDGKALNVKGKEAIEKEIGKAKSQIITATKGATTGVLSTREADKKGKPILDKENVIKLRQEVAKQEKALGLVDANGQRTVKGKKVAQMVERMIPLGKISEEEKLKFQLEFLEKMVKGKKLDYSDLKDLGDKLIVTKKAFKALFGEEIDNIGELVGRYRMISRAMSVSKESGLTYFEDCADLPTAIAKYYEEERFWFLSEAELREKGQKLITSCEGKKDSTTGWFVKVAGGELRLEPADNWLSKYAGLSFLKGKLVSFARARDYTVFKATSTTGSRSKTIHAISHEEAQKLMANIIFAVILKAKTEGIDLVDNEGKINTVKLEKYLTKGAKDFGKKKVVKKKKTPGKLKPEKLKPEKTPDTTKYTTLSDHKHTVGGVTFKFADTVDKVKGSPGAWKNDKGDFVTPVEVTFKTDKDGVILAEKIGVAGDRYAIRKKDGDSSTNLKNATITYKPAEGKYFLDYGKKTQVKVHGNLLPIS